jgi:transcriptional regulator with XRE-family HTH domain
MTNKPEPISEIDVAIGARIRARRELSRTTQAQLAKGCGVTFQQVQKYEKGTNRVAAARLYEIARFLDAPISYFYLDVDDRLRGENDIDPEINNQIEQLAGVAARLSPEDTTLVRALAGRLAASAPATRL